MNALFREGAIRFAQFVFWLGLLLAVVVLALFHAHGGSTFRYMGF